MFKKIGIFLQMIKFEHTVFALPFAFMGALLGSVVMFGTLPTWSQIGWIVVAMFGARSAAMGLNRLIDRISDAKNPRTAGRAIPAGLLKIGEVVIFIGISFFLLFWAAFKLNPLSAKLLPIAVFLLVIYSFTKRFTWACHLILGLTIALAPLGGWVAVTGSVNWTSMVFYFTIVFWTAGFDVIYSCQDVEFDLKEGLKSIPVRFGVQGALFIARVFHILTAIGFVSLLFMTDLSWWYVAGMIIAYIILFYEHYIVSPSDLSRLQTAFFTMNGVLSIVVFSFTLIDLVVQFY
ncbi:UbiA-like polyprenyltransferase [Paenibacillus sp. FSL R7-0048]|jgi:4-hydroxybenzoate polyprenyltransferase|uniref:4-hydroxybenzoate polyprenyltransferase n=1 Tax=Paenibacillus odorifer TaxID=189426 RepID=A0A1R0XHF9_9BACL|nr:MULTISPECIES: UbiA-like polyprenyltransferase [Paenibacillus]AWV34793.1 4-hydroxybenzoate octaprenyltransferase [Paenibacillus odorifer]MDH6427695.1 4-hydroxybenzoate polyprenyltransferase [Paenibacillus sp. PastH-4]MDH6444680.1 4-hydroxybenzoate polyprenyltransferase [Paenibacillus sp. PastF-4]MDH6528576.1 4-hydroxybenzoate polyprenyltransferase [Paenibacillus sp. PastH-3]OMC73407.1 4-hydroxybenzoate octaprenyltransferase [Paenibacillus odorifer]